MRIISGEFKGRKLFVPKGLSVRPTSDRAKETLFNILTGRYDIRDSAVLELFCGTGALGLECISRGAGTACFVDIDTGPVRKNIEALHTGDRCSVIRSDSIRFLKQCRDRYDFVFADPPYDYDKYDELIKSCLSVSDVAVIEHESDFEPPEALKRFVAVSRNSGRAVFTIFDNSIHNI